MRLLYQKKFSVLFARRQSQIEFGILAHSSGSVQHCRKIVEYYLYCNVHSGIFLKSNFIAFVDINRQLNIPRFCPSQSSISGIETHRLKSIIKLRPISLLFLQLWPRDDARNFSYDTVAHDSYRSAHKKNVDIIYKS